MVKVESQDRDNLNLPLNCILFSRIVIVSSTYIVTSRKILRGSSYTGCSVQLVQNLSDKVEILRRYVSLRSCTITL